METVTEYNEKDYIGTDVSLDVCVAESYMIMRFSEGETFDRTKEYNLIRHFPDYVEKELRGEILLDVDYSFDELVEIYNDNKESINSCCDTGSYINFEKPTEYDFLHLASDIDAYQGL